MERMKKKRFCLTSPFFQNSTPSSPLSQGIPSLLVAAASFDDIVAIALYTVFITLAVPTSSSGGTAEGDSASASKVWSIAAAPPQLVFGLALGLAGAAVCSASRLFDRAILRTAAVLLCALAQVREKGTGEEKSQKRSSASMPSRERGAFPRFRELVSSLPIHKSVKAIRVDHCI